MCLASDGTKVLVGTLGSDILELATVEKPKGEDGDEEEEASALSISACLSLSVCLGSLSLSDPLSLALSPPTRQAIPKNRNAGQTKKKKDSSPYRTSFSTSLHAT